MPLATLTTKKTRKSPRKDAVVRRRTAGTGSGARRRPDPSSKRFQASLASYEGEYAFWVSATVGIDPQHVPLVTIRSERADQSRRYAAQLRQPFWPAIRTRAVARKLEVELADVLKRLRGEASMKLEAARRGEVVEVPPAPPRARLLVVINEVLKTADVLIGAAHRRQVSEEHWAALEARRAELVRESSHQLNFDPLVLQREPDLDLDREEGRERLRERARADLAHATAAALVAVEVAMKLAVDEIWWRRGPGDCGSDADLRRKGEARVREFFESRIREARGRLTIASKLRRLHP